MSEDLQAKVFSLDAYRTKRDENMRDARMRHVSTDSPAKPGNEAQDILSYLLELGSSAPPEGEEEAKLSPVSALAREVMQRCIELGLVEEGSDEVAEGFSYDWGDSYISIDLFVLVELLEKLQR